MHSSEPKGDKLEKGTAMAVVEEKTKKEEEEGEEEEDEGEEVMRQERNMQ